MDTRKMTLFATIAAIALLAVGIGYAYTASTSNSGNIATMEYIELTQGGTRAYTFATNNVQWNTDDNINGKQAADANHNELPWVTTKYYLNGVETNIVSGYSLVQVGESFTINAEKTGGNTETIYGLLTSENIKKDANNDVALFIVLEQTDNNQIFKLTADNTFKNGNAFDGNNKFSIQYSNGAYKSTTVKVYYGYVTGQSDGVFVDHNIGVDPVGPSGMVLGTVTGEAPNLTTNPAKLVFQADSTLNA